MKYCFFLIVLIFILSASSVTIDFKSEVSPFRIVNQNNNKIYNYQLLTPNTEIDLSLQSIDSLEIFSRVPISSKEEVFYRYQVVTPDSVFEVNKSAKISSVSRGITGEQVSTYNKFVLPIKNRKESISIKNISNHDVYMKFDAPKYSKKYHKVDYISLSPKHYRKEIVLQIDENEYTYYSTNSHHVSFTLEGPIRLKIISRLLFDDTITNHQSYRFNILDNGEKEVEFFETARKSQKAKLLFDNDKGVSSGAIHFYEIDEGYHQIKLESPDKNRDIIFRIYIDKEAIGQKT